MYVDAAEQHEEGMYDFEQAVEQGTQGRSIWQLLRDVFREPIGEKQRRMYEDFYD